MSNWLEVIIPLILAALVIIAIGVWLSYVEDARQADLLGEASVWFWSFVAVAWPFLALWRF